MKNYTLDIPDVLSARLREKGWGDASRICYEVILDDDGVFEYEFEDVVVGSDRFMSFIFYQSYLDANNYMLINGKRPKGHVEKFIRAELERQCDE